MRNDYIINKSYLIIRPKTINLFKIYRIKFIKYIIKLNKNFVQDTKGRAQVQKLFFYYSFFGNYAQNNYCTELKYKMYLFLCFFDTRTSYWLGGDLNSLTRRIQYRRTAIRWYISCILPMLLHLKKYQEIKKSKNPSYLALAYLPKRQWMNYTTNRTLRLQSIPCPLRGKLI